MVEPYVYCPDCQEVTMHVVVGDWQTGFVLVCQLCHPKLPEPVQRCPECGRELESEGRTSR